MSYKGRHAGERFYVDFSEEMYDKLVKDRRYVTTDVPATTYEVLSARRQYNVNTDQNIWTCEVREIESPDA